MNIELNGQEKCELVMRQMRHYLREHQLAGLLVVCAPDHGAHALMVDSAPWLRVALVEDAQGLFEGIRVRSMLSDYEKGDLARIQAIALQKADLESTISAIDFLHMVCRDTELVTGVAHKALEKYFDSVTTSTRVGDGFGGESS